jgi:hypothetical protein
VAYALDPKYSEISIFVPVSEVLTAMKFMLDPSDELWVKMRKGFSEYTKLVNERDSYTFSPEEVSNGPEWHKQYLRHHDEFSNFAAALLSLPASASAAEGNWNDQGLIVNNRRTNLKDAKATKLVAVRHNLRAMRKNQKEPRLQKGLTYAKLLEKLKPCVAHLDFKLPVVQMGASSPRVLTTPMTSSRACTKRHGRPRTRTTRTATTPRSTTNMRNPQRAALSRSGDL